MVCAGLALACLAGISITGAAVLLGDAPRAVWHERDGERAEVPEPSTLSYNGRVYQVVHWGKARGLPQNGGYLAVLEQATGKELACIQIYAVKYDPEMETDVQDVFIRKLTLAGTDILIENELGERFVLDTRTLAVSRAKSIRQ